VKTCFFHTVHRLRAEIVSVASKPLSCEKSVPLEDRLLARYADHSLTLPKRRLYNRRALLPEPPGSRSEEP